MKYSLLPIEKTIEEIDSRLDLRGKSVIEIGAGSGATSIALAKKGAVVTCLDYADSALNLIRRSAQSPHVPIRLVQGDVFHLPLADNSFDICFHQGLLEHFPNPLAIILENHRITKTGGLCLFDVPQRYTLYTLKKHLEMRLGTWFTGGETEFSYSELKELVCRAGFTVIKGYGRFHIRHIDRIQKKCINRVIVPKTIERAYYRCISRLEDTAWGRATAFCIGIIAKKN